MIVVTTGIVVICVVTLDGHGANKDVRRQFLKGAAADRVSDRPPPLTRAVVGLSDEHGRGAYGESRGLRGVAWHRQQRSGRTGHGTTAGRHDPSGLGFRPAARANHAPLETLHRHRAIIGVHVHDGAMVTIR
jgi:hypothetical protein